ncbi:MAG: hypothetical protein ACPHEN_06700 [Candidatus Poseidoniaceae archaeon]|jgi:hypothetical protein
MNSAEAKKAADARINTMITPDKIRKWKAKIEKLSNPVFDGSINVNILPVSQDPLSEIITDICRQASGVASGLYLEDLIPLCNPQYRRSATGSGHDIHIPGKTAVDVKMSTETVKKGDKKGSSEKLRKKSAAFEECFFVEFFGTSKQEEINGLIWYSGAAAHRRLGLAETHVRWIAVQVSNFRKRAFKEIGAALR